MKVEINCMCCGKSFLREAKEVNRSKRLNKPNFCSRSCAAKINVKNIPSDNPFVYDISQHSGNKRDKYTGFRGYLLLIKKRYAETDIDLEYLMNLWRNQKGTCPYTGITLSLRKTKDKNSRIFTASIDRIDSSLPYLKGNIQYTSIAVNLMKSTMSDKETKMLIELIRDPDKAKLVNKGWQFQLDLSA